MCVKCSSKEASLLTAESSFPCWEPSVRHALNMHRNLNSKAVVFTVAFIFPSLFISYCDCKDTHKSISSSETFKSFFFNVYVSIGAREKKNWDFYLKCCIHRGRAFLKLFLTVLNNVLLVTWAHLLHTISFTRKHTSDIWHSGPRKFYMNCYKENYSEGLSLLDITNVSSR